MEILKNVKMSLNFNLRSVEAKKTKTPIYCVLKLDEKQYKIGFSCSINAAFWNKKKQCADISVNMTEEERNNNLMVNKKIKDILQDYQNYFSYLCTCDNEISKQDIKDYITNIVNVQKSQIMANKNAIPPKRTITAKTLLKKAFEMYYPIDITKEGTRKTQENRLNAFFNYIEETKKGDTPKLLTQEGINDYQEYLQSNGKSAKVINQYVQIICRLVNDILCIKSDFRKYNLSMVKYSPIADKRNKEETKKRALTKDEINAIKCVDTLTEKENEYRDIFVMQLNTGVRYSDLGKLFFKDYKEQIIEGVKTYIINTQKESITAAIAVNDEILRIQKKYEGGFKYAKFEEDKKNRDKYNNSLKHICEKAGLTQIEVYYIDKGGKKVKEEKRFCDIITNHFARHTFITLKLREGYTCEEVCKMTGHADTSMIEHIYEHLTDEDKAKEVAKAVVRVENKKDESTDKGCDFANEILIAKQAKDNYKLNKVIEIKYILNAMYANNHQIKVCIHDRFQLIKVNELFADFPTNEELSRVYDGANIIDIINERLRNHDLILGDDYIIRTFKRNTSNS